MKFQRQTAIVELISKYDIKTQEELSDKPVTLAIREVAEGKLTATVKEEYKN